MRLTDINEEFVSQAQRGYFYARAGEGSKKWKRMAKEFEDSTPKGKKLPYHVKGNDMINASPNDDIANRFLKTKDMPVTTANALVNLVFAVADGMPKGKRSDFLKMIKDRIEMRNDPFGSEKMMPGQEPYSDEERTQRDELVSGAADADHRLGGEFGEMSSDYRKMYPEGHKNRMKADKDDKCKRCKGIGHYEKKLRNHGTSSYEDRIVVCESCGGSGSQKDAREKWNKSWNLMPAKGKSSHAKNCACNMCRNMITQDFGVGPGGGSSDSSGFGL